MTPEEVAALSTNSSNLHNFLVTSWVGSPKTRGTWDVLWGCFITLSICIYTALHLNIPPYGEGRVARFLRKAKWVVCGLFAPEVTVYTAWNQFSEGRKLLSTMKLAEKGGIESQKWDLTKAFYVVMGGFAFDSSKISETYQRLVLTTRGVEFLAKYGQTPSISLESIEDKSKANSLAKGLSILQASWMIIQCIARTKQRLPLSLLEVHTVVHVICAFAMYAFWLHKPLDVQDPTLLDLNEYGELLSLMTMSSPGVSQQWGTATWPGLSEAQTLRHHMNNVQSNERELVYPPEVSEEEGAISVEPPALKEENWRFYITKDQFDSNTGFGPNFGPKIKRDGIATLTLVWEDAERWRLASRALKDFPELRKSLPFATEDKTPIYAEGLTSAAEKLYYVLESPANLQVYELDDRNFMYATFLALGAAYGGVHAAVSDYTFPSLVEGRLWYLSSLFIATSGPILVVTVSSYLQQREKNMPNPWSLRLWFKEWNAREIIWKVILLLQFLVILLYSASRLFIIVEVFISLRRAPLGVFNMITWTDYVVHI